VPSFNPKLFPKVGVNAPAAGETKFNVQLENRGGGIGELVVLINGKKYEFPPGARGEKLKTDVPTVTVPVDLTGDPRLIPGEKNVIEIQAFNKDGLLRSRGLDVELVDPRKKSDVPINLWAVISGITHYQGGEIDLAYPAKDAQDFATGLTIAANRLFKPENVHITLLTSPKIDDAAQPDADHLPTRDNLKRAFESLASPNQIKSTDIVVIYLAGHGVARTDGKNDAFYYLTCDAQDAELNDPNLRQQWSISDAELAGWLGRSPALKQVMILDTCHSGKFVDDLAKPREVSSSEQRALEGVKDSTGFHILAGCAADRASYEASRFGQGLLT
jgi:hypothetical protein